MWWLWLGIVLSSWRLTRIIVRDSFPPIAVQRARVAERWGEASWQAYLSTCTWCAGVWVSGVVVLATWFVLDGLPVPWLMWGAASAVTGLLGSIDYYLDKASER